MMRRGGMHHDNAHTHGECCLQIDGPITKISMGQDCDWNNWPGKSRERLQHTPRSNRDIIDVAEHAKQTLAILRRCR